MERVTIKREVGDYYKATVIIDVQEINSVEYAECGSHLLRLTFTAEYADLVQVVAELKDKSPTPMGDIDFSNIEGNAGWDYEKDG